MTLNYETKQAFLSVRYLVTTRRKITNVKIIIIIKGKE